MKLMVKSGRLLFRLELRLMGGRLQKLLLGDCHRHKRCRLVTQIRFGL